MVPPTPQPVIDAGRPGGPVPGRGPVPPRATRPAGPAGPLGPLLVDTLASIGAPVTATDRALLWGSTLAGSGLPYELRRVFGAVDDLADSPGGAADADLVLSLLVPGLGSPDALDPAAVAAAARRVRPGGVLALVVAEPRGRARGAGPAGAAPSGVAVTAEWVQAPQGPGRLGVARMQITNRSRRPWGMPPEAPALVGARWFDGAGRPVAVDLGFVPLPAGFPAGGEVSGTIGLTMAPGAAWAELDVAHPGHGWGVAAGGSPARLPVTVPPGEDGEGASPERRGGAIARELLVDWLAAAGLVVSEPLELTAGPGRGLWIGPPDPLCRTWLVAAHRPGSGPEAAPAPRPAVTQPAPGAAWPYRCSIVIPTYNRVEIAQECLVSLGEHTPDGAYEVVVVDNASEDGLPDLLDQLDGDVQVIRNPVNRGFAMASNQGAVTAVGEHLVFLNADIIARPGWLEPLLARLDGDPSIGAVGCRLLYPDGRLQHGGVWLLDTPFPAEPLRAVHRWYQEAGDRPQALEPGPVTAVTAAVVAVRREAWEAVGGFDPGYWNGYEDIDLCLRLRAAGWGVWYEPASTLVHAESVSGPERFSAATANIVRLQRWKGLVPTDGRVERDGAIHLYPSA